MNLARTKSSKSYRRNPVHFKNDRMRLEKWVERDRRHLALVNDVTGAIVVEWWDEELDQAIEDGILDPKDFMKSAMQYARDHKLIWTENRPGTLEENPVKRKKIHPKLSKFAGRRVSKKIAKLIREGYKPEQAAAIAFEMERKHRIGPRGGKKNPIPFIAVAKGLQVFNKLRKNPFEGKEMWMVLSTLCGLLELPSGYMYVPRELLATLRTEGLYDDDSGVTRQGKKFIEAAVKEQSKIEGY